MSLRSATLLLLIGTISITRSHAQPVDGDRQPRIAVDTTPWRTINRAELEEQWAAQNSIPADEPFEAPPLIRVPRVSPPTPAQIPPNPGLPSAMLAPVPSPFSPGDPNLSLEQKLLAASGRITVNLAGSESDRSRGTGTIIGHRMYNSRCLNLGITCGHLIRDYTGDTLDNNKFTSTIRLNERELPSRFLDYLPKVDAALFVVETETPLPYAPISFVEPVRRGDPMVTAGCGHGVPKPEIWYGKVNSIDRYQGHSNIEVSGAPVEGRSGGGLFTMSGRQIGICFAADPVGDEGLYNFFRPNTEIYKMIERHAEYLNYNWRPSAILTPVPSAPIVGR